MTLAFVLLPFIIPTVLSTFAWKWMFDPTFSVINWTLFHLGIIHARIDWLCDPILALVSVIIVNRWRIHHIPVRTHHIWQNLFRPHPELEPQIVFRPGRVVDRTPRCVGLANQNRPHAPTLHADDNSLGYRLVHVLPALALEIIIHTPNPNIAA